MGTDLDRVVLHLASHPVAGAWDRIRRYCGLPWSGGPPEVWAFPYYDAVVTDPAICGPVDVLATAALHPGLGKTELAAFAARRADLEAWLAAVPPTTRLIDRHPDALAHLGVLRDFDERLSLPLLTKLLHRKRPSLVPLVDRDVLDRYRPLTGERSATTAWEPLLAAIADDLERNAEALHAMSTALATELHTVVTPLRLLDIAIWMGPNR